MRIKLNWEEIEDVVGKAMSDLYPDLHIEPGIGTITVLSTEGKVLDWSDITFETDGKVKQHEPRGERK
jgi:hypothetical protein